MVLKFNFKPYIAIFLVCWFLLVFAYSQIASAQEATPTPIPTLQSTPGATGEPIDTPKSTDEPNNSVGRSNNPDRHCNTNPNLRLGHEWIHQFNPRRCPGSGDHHASFSAHPNPNLRRWILCRLVRSHT